MAKKTIYEISKELHVAPSTISKALNGVKGVNEKTRKRIVEYAKENGYVANPTARALKSKNNYTIGILYSEASSIGLEHPFFSPVLQSAKTYLEQQGYDLIFINSKSKDYQSYEEFCSLRNIAGIFIVSSNPTDILLKDLCNHDEFKIVSTDYINDDVVTVMSDNYNGVKTLVEYFKRCNFKNVGLVCHVHGVKSFKERYDAFIKECELNNINVSNIIPVGDYTFKSAYNSVDQFLNENKAPEAIFTLSDLYGVATIRALREHHYKLPNDVSVVGYDDIELSRYVTPSLSTLAQNAKEIGETAAKLLLLQLNGTEIEKKIVRIPVDLKLRDSSKEDTHE